ncbi:LysM peptidoglycan-binding domain-containing protein [Aquitalea aquatica]|uniref:LysM peptidoglycan-binding domain-containing protein n=1 Tax=Aquitalea aquatica TaxID=3044273 RepID=UPI001C697B00|nr:LysM peptidoglycan-binding domain-containing protein [Aquitalea magnusonii]
MQRNVYDKDGRLTYSIDVLGYVIQRSYDANGNVTQTVRYVNKLVGSLADGVAPAIVSAAPASGAYVLANSALDRAEYTVYDAANRATFQRDAQGYLTEWRYDAAGNLTSTVHYANLVQGNWASNVAPQITATAPAGGGSYVVPHASDQATRTVYDAAGRPSFSIDAEGYVTSLQYDANGKLTQRVRYANRLVSPLADGVVPQVLDTAPASGGGYLLRNAAQDAVTLNTYDSAGRLMDSQDGAGNVTRQLYDAASRVVGTVRGFGTPTASRTRYVYDAAGRMMEETRGDGTDDAASTRYRLDATGNRVAEIDPRGVELAEHDSAWALAERKTLGYVDASGNAKTVAVLSVAEKDALLARYTTSRRFDALGRKLSETDALGGVTRSEYDAFGNAVKVTDPRGYSGYFYFDARNQSVLHIDPAGYATASVYDAFGQLVQITHYANAVIDIPSTGTPPTLVADAAHDQVTRLEHDRLGQQTKITDAAGQSETLAYDAFGNKTRYTNQVGGVFDYRYDHNNRLIEETLPVQSRNAAGQLVAVLKRYAYDARGNRIEQTEAVGLPEQRTTVYNYDALDRLVLQRGDAVPTFVNGVTGATTPTNLRRYDARGNLIEQTDANGNKTSSWFDALNRKVAERSATGTLTQWDYDDAGNAIAQRIYADPVTLPADGSRPLPVNVANMRETRFRYDANNRLIETRLPNQLVGSRNPTTGNYEVAQRDLVSTRAYDANGNVVQETDARGNSLYRYYDSLGRKTLEVDAERYATRWDYDGNGKVTRETRYATRLTQAVDATTAYATVNGAIAISATTDRVSEFVYDQLGRVLEERCLGVQTSNVDAKTGAVTETSGTVITRYLYNGLGKLIQKTDATGSQSNWQYDVLGRETRRQDAAFTDYQGNMVRPTTDTEYNGLDQVARSLKRGTDQASETDDQITRYGYGAGGRLLSQTDAAGATTQYDYDAAGNVTRTRLTRLDADGASITDITHYRYDAALHQIEKRDDASGVRFETRYNAYGQIEGKRTGTSGSGDWQEYAEYDGAGRLSKSNSSGGVSKAYVYDANGNATLTLESAEVDQRGLSLEQLLQRNDLRRTVSVYDARNQLTATYQPESAQARDLVVVKQWQGGVPQEGGGGVVEVGPGSQVVGATETNPLATGSVAVMGGAPGQVKAWFASVVPKVYSRDTRNVSIYYEYFTASKLHVELPLPTGAAAYGAGDFVVNVQFKMNGKTFNAQYTLAPSTTALVGDVPISVALSEIQYGGGYWIGSSSSQGELSFTVSKRLDNNQLQTVAQGNYASGWSGFFKGTMGVAIRTSKDGGYDIRTSNYSGVNAALSLVRKELLIKGQPQGASRVVLLTRPAGSNTGWSMVDVPPTVVGGQVWPGQFSLDWTGMARGSYDMRYVALDAAGNVLNSEQGSLVLSDSAPTITQTPRTIGGAGKAFLDAAGQLNITEQGSQATKATVRFRTPGGAWSTAYSLTAASVAGTTTPGWFAFTPASYGLAAGTAYEYVLETQTSTGATVGKVVGSFTAGNANAVGALTAYANLPQLVHFKNQPLTAIRGILRYRLAGSSGTFSEAALVPDGSGAFYWDPSGVYTGSSSADFDFEYQLFDAADQMLNWAKGQVRFGTDNRLLSHTGLRLPSVVTFTPPQQSAVKLQFSYRPVGSSGAYTTATLSRAAGAFRFDASSLMPASGSVDFEYFYQLLDAAGTPLQTETGSPLRIDGTMHLGPGETGNTLRWVITGLASSTNVIQRQQRYNAFGEIAQEVDGLGRVTDFSYTTFGKLLQKQDPETTITLENGFQQRVRPTTRYYYDAIGNAVAVKDANGNFNRQVLLAGSDGATVRNASEIHADGGTKRYGYDVYGNLRYVVDEIGRRTDYGYDAMNRLVRVDRPQRASGGPRGYDAYDYDAAGRRIAHRTSADGSTVLRDKTYYDSLGRVIKVVTAAGRTTTTGYIWDTAILGAGGAVVGGWRSTVTDANGRSQIDDTDLYGHRVRHVDLGGHVFNYRYNWAGQLSEQTGSTGQAIRYAYYGNGYLKSISDLALDSLTLYEYDAEGNKTFEGYTTVSGGTARTYYEYAEVSYDELNRVKEIKDPTFTTQYEYDAVGNRRHVFAYYHDGINGTRKTQDNWYRYDVMNRFVVSMGSLNGTRAAAADGTTAITKGTGGDGVEIAYNAAGERITATYARDGHRETYGYSADGYLETMVLDANPNDATPGTLRAKRTNDLMGRVTQYSEYQADGVSVSSNSVSTYDADSKLIKQVVGSATTTYNLLADGTLNYSSQVDSGTTVTSYYGYEWWDEAKQSTVTANPYNANAPGWKSGTSHYTYDINGHLKAAIDEVGSRRFGYISNAQGLILKRDEIAGSVNQRHDYYYLDGQRVGDVGNDSDTRIDYAQALARGNAPSRKEQYKHWQPIASADFDQNYEPIGPGYPGNTPGSYTVRAGDTLQSIARALWGDSAMWYLLADTNGLSGSETLSAGQTLTVPNKVTNVHNNNGTFRVYNPGEAIGDTTPTLPDAPPPPSRGGGGGCGGFGMVFVAVIAVVAVVMTAGAAAVAMTAMTSSTTFAGAMATTAAAAGLSTSAGIMAIGSSVLAGGLAGGIGLAAAAIGGAVGSIASQGVAMAMGMQDKFSWSQVGTSALGAAVTSGVASGGSTASSGWSGAAAAGGRAMLGSTLTQGIAVATGMQKSFNWTAVAASGLGAAASFNVVPISNAAGPMDNFVNGLSRSLVSGGVQSIVGGGKPNWGAIAAESFGSALGNSMVERLATQERLTTDTTARSEGEGIDGGLVDAFAPRDAAEAIGFRSRDDFWTLQSDVEAPAGDGGPRSYSVQKGDTFSKVAKRVGLSAAELAAANPGVNQFRLRPGQSLVIPEEGSYSDEYLAKVGHFLDKQNQQRIAASEAERIQVLAEKIHAGVPLLSLKERFTSSNALEGLLMPFSMASQYVAAGASFSQPKAEAVSVSSLARSAASGFGRALYGFTVGTAENAGDLVKAGLSVMWNEAGGRQVWNGVTGRGDSNWYPEMAGPVAQAYRGGVSQGALILSSVPVLNLVPAAFDGAEAAYNGRWNQVAEMGGGFAAGALGGKLMAKYGGYGLNVSLVDINASGLGRYQTGALGFDVEVVRPGVPNSEVLSGGPRLLSTEGNVGTYLDLMNAGSVGDNITPHHIPSANRMALSGVSKGDGIAINMEQPVPGVGGRHRATFTYGTQADINMTPRDALAAGIWDARAIYRADGLYTPQIRSSLQELIWMNKANHPTIFVK